MKSIEQVVRDNLGPPLNIENVIRTLGIDLDKKAELHPDISGQIERTAEGGYKISVNRSDNYLRQRFTMAHELGHYVFHQNLIGDGLDDNRVYRSAPEGKFHNTLVGPSHETEANRFAAAILMPKSRVLEKWAEVADLVQTAKVFQVSKPAMEIRLKALGLVDPA